VEGAAELSQYFAVRTVPFAGASWTYADARNVLLVVFGLTERTNRLVLIRQYRPPVAAVVLSAPMGCYPDAAVDALLPVAAAEAEAETGHRVARIAHLLDFARSPGLTTERARCFIARYAETAGPRRLHADERIEVCYVPRGEIGSVVERAAAAGEVIDSSTLLCGPWLLARMESLVGGGPEAEPGAAPDRGGTTTFRRSSPRRRRGR
jgi:hypothetical protein